MTQHATEIRTFDSGDGPLAYLDTGTGRPLVLLHGGLMDHRMWEDQLPALTPEHRVIAPDIRGHGASANASRPFRPADDLAGLLRHLGLGPVVVVGLSMGGGIALDLALEHPELVSALVISGNGTSEPEFQDPWLDEIAAEEARALAEGDVEGWISAFTRLAAGPQRSLGEVDREVVRRLKEMTRGTIAKHTPDEPQHLVPVADTWKRLAGITVPLLAVNGGIDSPDHIGMAERVARSVADGRTETVAGTGHYPNMERPEEFNAHLLGFLRTLPSQS
ncbi:alpha/beta fold hydrolase [Streptomyces sp. FH025]|uniref:alpha/beta fold hydrolase n=1 Tax=Streptomyces sp. FH025 TaxID=2815937 RepID=UPI001A9ED68C|nr:alpha/beta hydrolase [Streptomyces sp. FH025]MBO1417548.1 alpha/beta hydrolase [Streptomyces sp. FH025]